MNDHNLKRKFGGEGNMGWMQATCSCGWEGGKHYAYNDTQHTDTQRDEDRHVQKVMLAARTNGGGDE